MGKISSLKPQSVNNISSESKYFSGINHATESGIEILLSFDQLINFVIRMFDYYEFWNQYYDFCLIIAINSRNIIFMTFIM